MNFYYLKGRRNLHFFLQCSSCTYVVKNNLRIVAMTTQYNVSNFRYLKWLLRLTSIIIFHLIYHIHLLSTSLLPCIVILDFYIPMFRIQNHVLECFCYVLIPFPGRSSITSTKFKGKIPDVPLSSPLAHSSFTYSLRIIVSPSEKLSSSLWSPMYSNRATHLGPLHKQHRNLLYLYLILLSP